MPFICPIIAAAPALHTLTHFFQTMLLYLYLLYYLVLIVSEGVQSSKSSSIDLTNGYFTNLTNIDISSTSVLSSSFIVNISDTLRLCMSSTITALFERYSA